MCATLVQTLIQYHNGTRDHELHICLCSPSTQDYEARQQVFGSTDWSCDSADQQWNTAGVTDEHVMDRIWCRPDIHLVMQGSRHASAGEV